MAFEDEDGEFRADYDDSVEEIREVIGYGPPVTSENLGELWGIAERMTASTGQKHIVVMGLFPWYHIVNVKDQDALEEAGFDAVE